TPMGQGPYQTPSQAAGPKPPAQSAHKSSFLDDWLNKRRKHKTSPAPESPVHKAQPAGTPGPQPQPMIQKQTNHTMLRDEAPVMPATEEESATNIARPAGSTHDFGPSPNAVMPPQSAPAGSTHNISSTELEGNEIHKIAEELKQQLNGNKDDK